jgi:hypothetical protein
MPNHRLALLFLVLLMPSVLMAQPIGTTFLENVSPAEGLYGRLLGSEGKGYVGVPVAAGYDLDLDGHMDYAMASMQANPQGRIRAGLVYLVFGDGKAAGVIDTANPHPRILEIHGDQRQESTGSEIWMAEITGDDYGDLLICRQNFTPDATRIGAGALTIIPGSPQLRTLAANGTVLDLRNPPEDLTLITIIGANAYSRLCIWARNGDITGDGIDDLAIGADQEANGSDTHGGAVYLLRGGDWLLTSDDIDLADFGTVAAGKLARVRPSRVLGDTNTDHYHFGATVQMADLDGDKVVEMIAAAALNRAGASLAPLGGVSGSTHSGGGTPSTFGLPDRGTVYVAWADNFAGNWEPAPDIVVGEGPGTSTIISGGINAEDNPGPDNADFGEEILGGLDYDNNGTIDLFVGDLTADGFDSVTRSDAGLGHIIYDFASLKGLEFDLDAPPEDFQMASFLGPVPNAIAGDTALHGDFNADGIDDLAFSSPKDSPFGVANAGTLHILLGKNGKWPVFSDLRPANYPSSADVQIHEIYGGSGTGGSGGGDILCYSAASGDMTGDGRVDLIINEMIGDGSDPDDFDAGNLIIIDSMILFNGQVVLKDGFESSGPD